MLKKFIVFVFIALSMSGCGSTPTNKSNKTATSSKITSMYYHQLDKKEQSKVFFTFKALADDSQNDGKYIIDMQVKNNTQYQLKFDLSKFILSKDKSSTAIKSAKQGKLSIGPHKMKTVAELFDSVTVDNFKRIGEFCYLSRDFVLAYSYQADKDRGATTDNLKLKFLIVENANAEKKTSESKTADQNQPASSSSESVNTQQVSQASTQPTQQSQASSAPVHVVNSAEQAKQIAAPFLNVYDASGLRATPVDDGWQVGPQMTYADVIVHYNGRVFSPANPATGQPDHWLN